MLGFSAEQISNLARTRADAFAAEMSAHLLRFAPRHAGALGEPGLEKAVGFGLGRARARGFDRRGPARLWLETSMILGGFWDESPLFAGLFAGAFDGAAEDQTAASETIFARLSAYVGEVLGPDRAPVRRALTALRSMADDDPPAGAALAPWLLARTERSFPERWDALGAQAHHDLVVAALGEAAAFGARTPRHGALWALLALTLGHGFARDPFNPWAAHVLDNVGLGGPEARLERLATRSRIFLDAALAAA